METPQQPTAPPVADLSLDNLSALLLGMKDDKERHPHIRAIAGTCAVLAKHIQRIGQRAGVTFLNLEQRITALETTTKEVVEFLNAANVAATPSASIEPSSEAPKSPDPTPAPPAPPAPVPKLNAAPKKKTNGGAK